MDDKGGEAAENRDDNSQHREDAEIRGAGQRRIALAKTHGTGQHGAWHPEHSRCQERVAHHRFLVFRWNAVPYQISPAALASPATAVAA